MANIDFFLCPDKTSARYVRRSLAERHGALIGQQVGTWLDLLELVQHSYCLQTPDNEWEQRIDAAMAQIPDAFWADSLATDPESTRAMVATALTDLLTGIGPGLSFANAKAAPLSPRGKRQLTDLLRLQEHLQPALPHELAMIQVLLDAPAGQNIRGITVYHALAHLHLNPWQMALLQRLQDDSKHCVDAKLLDEFTKRLAYHPGSPSTSVLNRIQRQLFDKPDKTFRTRKGMQWIGVRDYLQELEIAVGMIQEMVRRNAIGYSDIGLLLPEDQAYTQAASTLFTTAGIPLSGMNQIRGQRDLGRELIYLFLHSRQPTPTPPMVQAAMLESPLLPWHAQGIELAQKCMDGNSRGELEAEIPESQHLLLRLLLGKPITEPDALARSLKGLAGQLTQTDAPTPAHHAALATIQTLLGRLDAVSAIPWETLLRDSLPAPATIEEEGEYTLEGVTVFHPGRLPWRRVRHLLVLGFQKGLYPGEHKASAIIPEQDRQILNQRDIAIRTAAQQRQEARLLFRRQISAASDSLSFLIPRSDAFGAPLSPSVSLLFMAQFFDGIDSENDLILELDNPADHQQIACLAQARAPKPVPPRPLTAEDLELGTNLLTRRKTAEGKTAPESPSGLEKLMISPLAWVFNRYGIVSNDWTAQEFDAITRGNIAHNVFQELFQHQQPIPSQKTLEKRLPDILNEKLEQECPFLLQPEWHVERQEFARMLTEAAGVWRQFLRDNKIEILAEEKWLEGRFHRHPIHGKADLIIAAPDGSLYVVDYKTSSSNGRREQMRHGYDSQATLYQIMLTQGSLPADASRRLKQAQKKGKDTGVLYYTLRDQTILGGKGTETLRDTQVVETNISGNALSAIRSRMNEVRSGLVRLNTDEDRTRFEKNGVKPWALDDSPLIELFMKPGDEA